MRRSSTCMYSLGMLLATAGAALAAPARTAPIAHLGPRAACTTQAITCGQTISGALATTDCSEVLSGKTYYEDLYQFHATAGQQIAISESSTAIFPLVFLVDTNGNNVAQDNNSGVASSQVSFTIPTTGNYVIGAASLESQETGAYGLTLFCGASGSTTCTEDANTLCLNNGRFRVTAVFNTSTSGANGTANEVKLTDDTGYLWFFNSANVETVLKVLNGCAVGGHYWFFAGGLTNVYTQIRVTDTTTGFTRLYTNPLNQPFEPIQDTSAFPSCP